MNWLKLDNAEKIGKVIEHIVSHKMEILLNVRGEKTPFTSRLVEIKKEDDFTNPTQEPGLIIESLTPNKGNTLIRRTSEIVVEFLLHGKRCRFPVAYVGTKNTPAHIELVVSYPKSIEIEENRKEDRCTYVSSEFVCAEFSLAKGSPKDRSYEVNVLDCSKYGLGLIITEKDFDLIAALKKGDKLEGIQFFTPWAMVKINGTVRHVTKIEDGEHKGSYVIGIESPDTIETCRSEANSDAHARSSPS